MTNKELISFECERLENLRQYLIALNTPKFVEKIGFYIEELGEITYELTAKIKDNGPTNPRKN